MIGTLGKGAPQSRVLAGFVHCAASGLTGAAFGSMLGAVGALVPRPDAQILLAGVAAAYGAMQLGIVRLPLPESGRQVPATWRYRFRHLWVVFLYGAALGPGIGTRVADAGFVPFLGAVALAGGPVFGGLALGTYGLVRAGAAAALATSNTSQVYERVTFGMRTIRLWRSLAVAQGIALLMVVMIGVTVK